jgi:hypothetical protein
MHGYICAWEFEVDMLARMNLEEAYAEVIRARFGAALTPEEWSRIKRDLAGNADAADRLRAIELDPEDEPDLVFRP